MSLSLDQNIEETTQNLLLNSSQVEQASKENFRSGERILEQIATLQEQIGQDAALIARTQGTAALQTQHAVKKVANAAGLNPNAGIDEITKTITQLNQTNQEVRARIANVRAQREVSFLDDPAAWMKSIFTLPGEIEKLRGAANQAQDLSTVLTQTNQAIQQTAQSQRVISESLTAESVEASARTAANLSLIKAKEAALEGLKYNTLGIEAAKKATSDQLGAMYNLRNARLQEKQFDRLMEAAEFEKEKFKWTREDRETLRTIQADARVEASKKAQLDDELVNTINIGQRILGFQELSGPNIKNQLALFKEGKTSELNLAFELGRKYQAMGFPIYGTSPAEALKTFEAAAPSIVQAKADTLALFQQVQELVGKDPRVAGATGKDKDEAFAKAFNQVMKQEITRQFSTVNSGTGNLFDIGDLRSYVGNGAEGYGITDLQGLGLTTKVLNPAIAAGQPLNDPKVILGLGVAGVKAGTITSAELQNDLATIYQKAVLINQQSKNFLGMGINLPDNGKHYYAKINVFGKPIDLTNPTEIGRYLNIELAAQSQNPFNMPVGLPGRRQ